MDSDGSGEIDFPEFAALVKKEAWIYELTDEEVQLAWSKIDVDGSGTIEMSEFAAWWQGEPGKRFKQLRCTPEERTRLDWAAHAFRDADADGSGSVDPGEFVRLHASLCEMGMLSGGARSAKHVLEELDCDGDDGVSFPAFVSWMLREGQYDALDTRSAVSDMRNEANDTAEETASESGLSAYSSPPGSPKGARQLPQVEPVACDGSGSDDDSEPEDPSMAEDDNAVPAPEEKAPGPEPEPEPEPPADNALAELATLEGALAPPVSAGGFGDTPSSATVKVSEVATNEPEPEPEPESGSKELTAAEKRALEREKQVAERERVKQEREAERARVAKEREEERTRKAAEREAARLLRRSITPAQAQASAM
jgi:Ca2+-binding EF-hand superfamily protein